MEKPTSRTAICRLRGGSHVAPVARSTRILSSTNDWLLAQIQKWFSLTAGVWEYCNYSFLCLLVTLTGTDEFTVGLGQEVVGIAHLPSVDELSALAGLFIEEVSAMGQSSCADGHQLLTGIAI